MGKLQAAMTNSLTCRMGNALKLQGKKITKMFTFP
jgi:hypothetical protein